MSASPDIQAEKQSMISAIIYCDLYRRSKSYQVHLLASLPIARSLIASGMKFFQQATERQRIG
jgi:hypothetical protein